MEFISDTPCGQSTPNLLVLNYRSGGNPSDFRIWRLEKRLGIMQWMPARRMTPQGPDTTVTGNEPSGGDITETWLWAQVPYVVENLTKMMDEAA